MKIRNHKKTEWWFYPLDNSSLDKGKCYIFKYKSELMRFLNANIVESVGGEVALHEETFNSSYTKQFWFVWYNHKQIKSGANLKVDLRQQYFRGNKYMHRKSTIEKVDKKYFAFSDKVISLMSHIEDENGVILSKDAKRLVELFKKRGFKDFEPNEEDLEYINGHISDGIDFNYWSDRCSWLRTKTIIEYFKRKELI